MWRRWCKALRLGVLALLLPVAISAAEESPTHPTAISAHISPHSIRVGEPAFIEFAVVTPPEHRLLPFAMPVDLQHLEIETVDDLPVEERTTRWTHRTRIRFRPRETGTLLWPRTEFSIEASDGSISQQVLEPVPFDVRSVLPLYPGRSEPFGARPAPPRRVDTTATARVVFEGVAAAGSATLLALWLRRIARRRLRREPRTKREKPWTLALNDLEIAAALADPAAAANTIAGTLRRYMEGRFGASTRSRTAEELLTTPPPFGATSRWPPFTALLLELDAMRFAPPIGRGQRSLEQARINELLRRARHFVDSSMPPEALR